MRLEDEIKQKKFTSEYQRALLNIIFTHNWFGERMEAVMKPFDLSEQQYNVLRILRGQKGNPINLMDIQGRMLQKNSNVTRLVEKLRLKGFVDRVQNESNRRKVDITITKQGLAVLDEIEPELKKHHRMVTKNLTEKEAKQLADLLDKLRG